MEIYILGQAKLLIYQGRHHKLSSAVSIFHTESLNWLLQSDYYVYYGGGAIFKKGTVLHITHLLVNFVEIWSQMVGFPVLLSLYFIDIISDASCTYITNFVNVGRANDVPFSPENRSTKRTLGFVTEFPVSASTSKIWFL